MKNRKSNNDDNNDACVIFFIILLIYLLTIHYTLSSASDKFSDNDPCLNNAIAPTLICK